jgi:hypothetical protein
MSPKGVLEAFKGWMKSVGIQYSDAIELVDAAQGCSGLALGVRVRRWCCRSIPLLCPSSVV